MIYDTILPAFATKTRVTSKENLFIIRGASDLVSVIPTVD